MNQLDVASQLTILDLALLHHVSGGAPAKAAEPIDDIGPRVREEIGPDGEPVLVRIWY